MAKRAPTNETPYSPLDADLARSVMEGAPPGEEVPTRDHAAAEKVTEKPRKPKFPRSDGEKLVELPTANGGEKVRSRSS
jgi:hypothetical protein